MASVADITEFSDALSSITKSGGRHVWLDSSGLVAGNFPNPSHRYDFATEKFVSLETQAIATPKKVVSLLGKAGRVRSVSRIESPDAIYEVGSATQMLVEGLNLVERMRPGTMQKLSLQKGRTKRPVALSRDELYDYPHPPKHSAKLENGYFVATNNKAYEALGYLKEAIRLAHLQAEIRLRP